MTNSYREGCMSHKINKRVKEWVIELVILLGIVKFIYTNCNKMKKTRSRTGKICCRIFYFLFGRIISKILNDKIVNNFILNSNRFQGRSFKEYKLCEI